jgi:ATP-dependent helicase/nuclease subunit B
MPLARTIADALRRGATIVAASARSARSLQVRFAEDQRALDRSVWPTPSILDWDVWLRNLWRDHAFAVTDAPALLTPLQERVLWRSAQRDDAHLVISPDSMAALAMDAWTLLSAYRAHGARRSAWEQTDAERFRHWAAAFEQYCSRQNWLSAAQVEEALVPHVATGAHLELPAEILLVGFDRITPAQRGFLDAVQSRGARISEFVPEPEEPANATPREWIAGTDLPQEIEACAGWAQTILADSPGAKIGVVVPSIASARGAIDRSFRRILLPASEDIRRPAAQLPWEFSLGHPLSEVPAIRAALLLLRWTAGPLSEEQVSWLMLSGFVADTATNRLNVAKHDARLRRFAVLSTERTLQSYRESLTASSSLHDLRFRINALQRAAEQSRLESASRQPSVFADLVPRLLECVAWPGQRPDDSVQYQARQRWQRLLDEIALLDFDGARYSWKGFVALLEQQAQETIFSPESHNAPVQVMGPFESSGQQFDAVWFLGTDDTAWPQRGRLHPLIPAAVQRQYGMPHATPDDDWNLADTVTARLLHSAGRVVFSFAQRDKDAELRPSPLIARLFPKGSEPQVAAPRVAEEAPSRPAVEAVTDDSGVLAWPRGQNAGGADVLKRQAACAFQAFATKRLRAEPLDESEWGISPSQKGKLLHAVMESLFSPDAPSPLLGRDDLVNAIAANQLSDILETHIDAAMRAQFGAEPADPWQRACLQAEKRRLMIRIGAWLELESKRQPFTVESCEKRLQDVHVGALKLNLRADRIDRLPDGSRLLLDYKTGNVSTANWEGDRPDDPQLPLYAAYGNVEDVSGILFARIRSGKIEFEGCVRNAQGQLSADIPNKKTLVTRPYSEAMREEWARVLARLGEDFLRGEAAVAPRDPKVCTFCGLHALCRIAESSFVPDVADDSSDDDGDS